MLTTLEERVEPGHTALLIVDMQNDFVHQEGVFARVGLDVTMFQEITPRVIDLTRQARALDIPVIFIQMNHSKWTNSDVWLQRRRVTAHDRAGTLPHVDLVAPGSWGAKWYGDLQPGKEDFVVTKHRYSAFINTNLDLVLRSLKCRTLVVTGGETSLCLGTTAMDGLMHDYYIVLPEDCIAGIDPETHRMTLGILDRFFGIVTTSDEIMKIWRKA